LVDGPSPKNGFRGERQKKVTKATIIILFLMVLFLLAGVLPSKGGMQTAVFRTPVFIALAVGLCVFAFLCATTRRGSWARRIPFLLSHVGVVILLAGAWGGFLWGIHGDLVLPLTEQHRMECLRTDEGQNMPLGFQVAAKRFQADYYSPYYDVYRPGSQTSFAKDSYVFVRRVPVEGVEKIDLGEGGQVPIQELKSSGEESWLLLRYLTNGWMLRQAPRAAKLFEAELVFTDMGSTRTNGVLRVNHPLLHHGWFFYLKSFDEKARRYVIVSVRQDPSRGMVIVGIWMLILGTAWLCWQRS
jgi:hypothetical protein